MSDNASTSKDYSNIALIIGGVGMAIALAGLARGWTAGPGMDAARPFLGYLVSFAFWLSIGIGMLMLTMISWIFDAGWSIVIRRQMEHAIGAFKVLAILFLPLLATLFHSDPGLLWKWLSESKEVIVGAHVTTVAEDVLWQSKNPFLNPTTFIIFSAVIFGVFIGFSEIMRFNSQKADETGDPKYIHNQRWMSAIGIISTALALTFGSIYWFKSLEYHWFSTMYGVWFFAASIWSSLAATVILLHLKNKTPELAGIFNKAHYYLLGCLMLAFTVFWAYISFSQYFLIYNANIPEETFWYNIRAVGGFEMIGEPWWWVAMLLIFGHFFAPFLILLFYESKRTPFLFFFSFYVLAMHLVDLYWNILPGKIPAADGHGYSVRGVPLDISLIFDIGALAGIGGLCIWAFLQSSKKGHAIPIRDPRILESINCHE